MNLCVWLTATTPNTEVFYLQKGLNNMKEHAFDTEHAVMYGVNCAIILHELEKYINCGHPNSKIHRGKTWVEIDIETFGTLFPYLSKYAIKTALKTLIRERLIIVDSLNKSKLDRKLWYAISDRGTKELNGGVKIWVI